MSWHYSRALVEASSVDIFSDGEQSAPSSLIPMPEMFWSQGRTTDAFRRSRSGMTCKPLMDTRGEAVLTWCLEASPVKTSARLEARIGKESKASDRAFGHTWRASFARYDRDSHSWKTAQRSLFEGLDVFLEIWPRWGMMRDGACSPLAMLEHDTSVRGFGSLPVIGTPIKTQRARSPTFLTGERALNPCEIAKGENGKARPEWCEHLMLWPVGWTDIAASAMGKFQQWQRLHGKCFALKKKRRHCDAVEGA